MDIWEVDAAHGGGQLVRTALCLAALAQRPCHITGIRAGRSRPGLARQHVAAVKAVGAAADGELRGAQLGSQELWFEPGETTAPLDLNVVIGTAGSTMLVLQTLLPLLARRGGEVRAHGGTDNPLAPPVDFYLSVLLPALATMGVEAELELVRRGYYPKGGGEVQATAPGQARWRGIERVEWDEPVRLAGVAYSSSLPLHVTERMRRAALQTWKDGKAVASAQRPALRALALEVELQPAEQALSPGAGIVLWVEDRHGTRVSASALGELGKPAEQVGEEAATALLREVGSGAPCDQHLGDQLAIWAALADGPSAWRVSAVTDHLQSSLDLLADGLGVRWQVDGTTVRRLGE